MPPSAYAPPQKYADYSCFFNDTATTETYPLSLHDALPIWNSKRPVMRMDSVRSMHATRVRRGRFQIDRKSTRLNSSHRCILYDVFCLKKKKHQPTVDCNRHRCAGPCASHSNNGAQ